MFAIPYNLIWILAEKRKMATMKMSGFSGAISEKRFFEKILSASF